jgi:capsular polysaccharide biosynthesis protein
MSRRDAKRRAMANELALEEALAARGVKPIMLTGLSFAEKVSLFRDAPLIIGAHGAGFGTLVFSKPGRNVIEILPAYTPFTSHTQFTHHRTNLPNVSRIIGHNHYHYLALPKKSIDGQGWGLDIPKFLEFFDQHFG